MGGDLNVKLG